jgi:hypothetical protein
VSGRPTLLTRELVDRALEMRRDGAGVDRIAADLGVSRRTVQRGLASRRAAEVAIMLDQWWQTRTVEPTLVAVISRAAQGDWRAAAWILERAYPERWGQRSMRVACSAESPPDLRSVRRE